MIRTWPLVGRAEELRFVQAAMRRRSRPRGVVLAGAAGVGKTRLAREALAIATHAGASSTWATATASAQRIPLGAFAPLVGAVSGDASQVVRSAMEALLGGGRTDVVIGVDDAHLLDDLSALLVHHLVVQSPMTVVVTVRTGEPLPDAVSTLWKDGHLDRLEVQSFSELETAALLETVLGAQVDRRAARRLWELTQGNALFLQQLVEAALDSGALRAETGVWRLVENLSISLELTEAVTARMGGLSSPVRDVVDLLAIGEPLGVTDLAELTDPATVEDAEERGLVRVEREGRRLTARLAHPLYGEVQRERIGHVRARRLRGAVATALTRSGSKRADDLLRRAVLHLDADLEPDADLLTQAGERALQLVDFPLAERLGRAALGAGGGVRAQRVTAVSLIASGRPDEADTKLAALVEAARTDAEYVSASVDRIAHLAWMVPRPDAAEAILDGAIARVAEPGERRPLVALRAMLDAQRGRPARAAAVAATILADEAADSESVVLASGGLAAALALTGRAGEIEGVAARGMAAAADSITFAHFRLPLVAFQVVGLVWAGNVEAAVAVARAFHAQVEKATLGTIIAGYAVGHAERASGRLGEARRWLREARAAIEPYGDTGGWRYAILIALTQTEGASGDECAGQAALADVHAHLHPTMTFLEPELVLARAWVAAAEGAVSGAVTLAQQAAGIAQKRGQLAHIVLALQTAAQFGDASGADRLAALAANVQGPRAAAAAAYSAALAAGDGEALHAASTELEAMGDLLAAGDAAAQAADAFARNGLKGSASTMAARADELAERCGGARTPALARSARPLPLTVREREIVALAARGLSNRAIAERLVVSVRTVEGHLYRASAKLGVTDRRRLAEVIGLDRSAASAAAGR